MASAAVIHPNPQKAETQPLAYKSSHYDHTAIKPNGTASVDTAPFTASVVTAASPIVERAVSKNNNNTTTAATGNGYAISTHDIPVQHILEPLKSFLLVNTHDMIIPLSTDTFTCPACHTPHAVRFVREDKKNGPSKDLFICLSQGREGCGWEDDDVPKEDDIHAHIEATIGFMPLRLN